MAILAEAKKAGQRLHHDFDQLMEKYPNRWVAVSKDGLVAHHDEVKGKPPLDAMCWVCR